MESDPAAPWTVAAFAERCGVGVRAMQLGFHRYVGLSPCGVAGWGPGTAYPATYIPTNSIWSHEKWR